jgi:putative MATE family efflux protein
MSAEPEDAAQRSADILSGPLRRPLLRLAWPMMAGYLFQIGFNWVDTYFVGRLGTDALAAVGSTMFVLWALLSFTEIVCVGTLSLVARAMGAKDRREASAVVLASGALVVLLSGTVAVVGATWVESIVLVLGLEPEPTRVAADYLRILLWGYPALAFFRVLESVFRGAGDTRPPMVVLAGAFALNMALDALLIFGWGPVPAFGVQGAAAATVIARGGGCLVLAAVLWRERHALGFKAPAPRWWATDRLLRIMRIGAPASAAGISFCLIYLVLVRITTTFGTAPVAALGVGLRMESLPWFLCVSFGRAAGAVAGQNLGARQVERARAAARLAMRQAWLGMTPIILVMVALPEACAAVFTDDPAVVEAAARYLRILGLVMPLLVVEVVLNNVAAGVGDTLPAMVVQAGGTALRIPVALGLVALGAGYLGVWWAVALTVALKAGAFEYWFRRERWARVGAT